MPFFVWENSLEGDVQQFAQSFESEARLREDVAQLFSKMPRVQGVQITHGSQEYGKDIIFYSETELGTWKLNACVVKNDKISGAADSAGARNVLIQIDQALDTPHINPNGQSEYVSHVYVITPHDCSQTTMRSIQGKLQGRAGQVTFLCGRLLLEQFSRHWPSYLAFETTLLGAYVAKLQRAFSDTDPIAFLMSQQNILSIGSRALTKVYVRQRFRKLLQQFDSVIQLPQPSEIFSVVTEEDVSRFAQKLVALASLLRHPEAWSPSGAADAEPTAAELTSLAESLRSTWKAEYERLRSERQRRGDHVPARSAIQVMLSLDRQAITNLLSRIQPIISNIETEVSAANSFASNCQDIAKALDSPEHLRYCAIHQVIEVAPRSFRRRDSGRELCLPESFLESSHLSVLITAPAGYGKTSFCKWHFLKDVERLAQSQTEIIPVYVPLHQLATIAVTNAYDVFLRSDDVRQLAMTSREKGRRIRFYLDGLDEVSTVEQQRRLMELAATLPTEFPVSQTVVTARDYVSGHWLRWLPRINLAELTEEQVQLFISNWLGSDALELSTFQKEIANTRTLLPLMKVPLLATLIVSVFKKMQTLPENKIKLYEIFVDLMCGGWDIAKNVQRPTRFGSNAKLAVLTRLAGHLHLNERREAEESDIRTVISESMPAFFDHWRTLLDELLEDGLLVKLAGGLGFAHLSFQEYLAARELTDPMGERQKLALRRFLRGEDWWREVLAFYVGLGQRPDEVAGWIKSVGFRLSRDIRSQDLPQRWDFLMRCIQDSAPGWNPPEIPGSFR